MTFTRLRTFAALSILAAVCTIGIKAAAYALTGSAGLLSDALESGVNLVAALTVYFSLWYAGRPADHTHTFGHDKFEYFAAGWEGVLILVAGTATIAYAVDRLVRPQPLVALELGSLLSGGAAAINFVVARVLLAAGRRHNSLVLEADGRHLLTDVYTSLGVVAGLILVRLTGQTVFDPLVAGLVGGNIMWTGFGLLRRSVDGLMDHALPTVEQNRLRDAIRAALPPGTDFHAVRTRQAGPKTFAEFHLLVPGSLTVADAHALAHQVEDAIRVGFHELLVTIHIEPIEERASWETAELLRLGESVPPPLGAGESP